MANSNIEQAAIRTGEALREIRTHLLDQENRKLVIGKLREQGVVFVAIDEILDALRQQSAPTSLSADDDHQGVVTRLINRPEFR